jgi:Na+/melibiose symporter-like transporter
MIIQPKDSSGEKANLLDYFELLRCNRNYRLYLLSHCMQHTGDWFVRVAALLSVERLAPDSSTAISIVILCKTLPEVFITPFGGILSDKFDRKKLMMTLDSVAAIGTLSYILALRSGSVKNFYLATIVRASVSSLYEPVTKSIFPMFITNPEDLKRAATLNGSAWVSRRESANDYY